MAHSQCERTIIHCDMDAFFAAVEQRDRPEYSDRPVLVGGSRERGVVCACSYQARPFGIHSGMAMSKALARCPDAVVLSVRMERYREVSRQVFAIFADFSDRVEPLSIDEAFLDVSGCRRLLGPGRVVAAAIRQRVRENLGLPISAGVAGNKFLAKLASAAAKPDGLLEIGAGEVDAFLLPLEVEKIWGVGRVMAEQLRELGITRVAELRRLTRSQLERKFGGSGLRLYELARGIDCREVETAREARSIGAEETFARDLEGIESLRLQLLALSERVAHRVRRQGLAAAGVILKVKYGDFSTMTRSRRFAELEQDAEVIWRTATDLLASTDAGRRPVRLLGVTLTGLAESAKMQPELFPDPRRERRRRLTGALDELCDRYGADGVLRAVLLDREGSVQRVKKGKDGGE